MTPNKLSIQVQLQINRFIEANFKGTLGFGKDSPWAKIPLKQYPQALEMLCQKINELPGISDRAHIAGKIINEIDSLYRKPLVERDILGKTLGVVFSELGQGQGEVCAWEDGFTEVNRLNNNKTVKVDLRGLGQIWRDAPALFPQTLENEPGSMDVAASNILLWVVSTLEKSTLSSQAMEDMAWTTAGLLEHSGKRLNHAAPRSVYAAQFLAQSGVEIPPLNVDGQILESSPNYLKKPVEEGRASLRRAVLMGQAKKSETNKPQQPAPKM